jgi:hypothetical protein
MRRSVTRWTWRGLLPAALLLALAWRGGDALAGQMGQGQRGPQPPVTNAATMPREVGSQTVSGSFWNLDGQMALTGSWSFLMVSNAGCGYGQPQPGGPGAQAGAFAYTGTLLPTPSPMGTTIWIANLAPIGGIEGGAGHVRVIGTGSNPGQTHVDVSLWDLPDYAVNNLLEVCLFPSP